MDLNLRPGFNEISAGWATIEDPDELGERLARVTEWRKSNDPLTEDEEIIVTYMRECQIARRIVIP